MDIGKLSLILRLSEMVDASALEDVDGFCGCRDGGFMRY